MGLGTTSQYRLWSLRLLSWKWAPISKLCFRRPSAAETSGLIEAPCMCCGCSMDFLMLGLQTVLASQRTMILSWEQQQEQKEQLERQVSRGACAVWWNAFLSALFCHTKQEEASAFSVQLIAAWARGLVRFRHRSTGFQLIKGISPPTNTGGNSPWSSLDISTDCRNGLMLFSHSWQLRYWATSPPPDKEMGSHACHMKCSFGDGAEVDVQALCSSFVSYWP